MADGTNASPTIFASSVHSRSYAVDALAEDAPEAWGPSRAPVSELSGDALRAVASGSRARGVPREAIDALEVFEIIRHLNDPEHPLTLEQLRVVSPDGITVDDAQSTVDVLFTPTIPHCRCAHPACCCF